jgi:hypothetical protein
MPPVNQSRITDQLSPKIELFIRLLFIYIRNDPSLIKYKTVCTQIMLLVLFLFSYLVSYFVLQGSQATLSIVNCLLAYQYESTKQLTITHDFKSQQIGAQKTEG